MSTDNNFLENFRVPKKKNKETLELLANDSDQRKNFVSKLQNSFKKPEISKDSMKFHRTWLINLSEMETIFSKKRLSMRNNSSRIFDSYGFFFLKNESELKKLVKVGKMEVGNIPESCLGNPKMGVSLSQYSDIYHPQVPKSGIILIVKYIKSKVHYLPYDTNPMDPQPNYDCHMMRNSQAIDQSTSCHKAFHSTQVFIYEYNEDCDIEKFPSQLLIVGAVQFSWHGNYIYKETNVTRPASQATKRATTTTTTVAEPQPPPKRVRIALPSAFIPQNSTMISSDMMSSTLIIGQSSKNSTLTHRLNVKLLCRLKEPSMIFNLINQNWNLVEVLRSDVFEDYLCYTDDSQIVRHMTLSGTSVVEFPNTFNQYKKLGGSFRPKFGLHLTMVPETVKDKAMMARIIDNLKSDDKVGSVRCNALSNILFYIFPSGKLSRVLGLSAFDAINSLHVVLLTEQHPQFLPCNFLAADRIAKREQKYFLEILKYYETSLLPKKPSKPLIALDTLKKAVANHILKQKQFNENFPRPVSAAQQDKDPGKYNDDSDMEVDSNPGDDIDASRIHEIARASSKPQSMLVNSDISAAQFRAGPPPVCNGGLPPTLMPIPPFPSPFVIHSPFPVQETVSVPPKGMLPVPIANGFYPSPPVSYLVCNPQQPFAGPQVPVTVPEVAPPVQTASIPLSAPLPRPQISDSILLSNSSSIVCEAPPQRMSLGAFHLVRVPSYQDVSRDKRLARQLGLTHRRPVILDSGIFPMYGDHCHISVYKG